MRKPSGQIVILASGKDPHVTLVERYLRTKPLLIDFGNLQAGLSYRLLPGDNRLVVTYAGKEIDFSLGAVKTVWNRRTNLKWLDSGLKVDPPEEYEYALTSLQNHADSVRALFLPEVFWVPNPSALLRANRKPLQLEEARHAGFKVPATLFTSDAEAAKAFTKKYGECIIKTQATLMPAGRIQYAVTRQGSKLDFTGLHVAPQIFQELIRPDIEVRAAVIGNEAFAAVVRDDEEQKVAKHGVRDFRASFLKGSFKTAPIELPQTVAAACVRYLQQMGLPCGYFDLICDKQGQWWFIECNPNGQWGFVDMATAHRIAQALAELLEAGKSPWRD
jgi:glutathione synthase/RimK-type ligase-like ATP-grasp enzyme